MSKIYLTERDIHRMIKESVQTLLLEALTPDEIYNNHYSGKIGRDIFDVAIAADPTSYNQQGEIVKVGSYVKWILNLAKQKKWKPGDSFETKNLLSKFIKHQKDLPVEQRDINRYSSISELYNTLKPYLNIQTRSEIKQKEATKVYEDEEWLIIIPHTEKAACRYGANTRWCTAAKEDNMFDYYNNRGPLYINIYKPENRKYQFHFKSRSFMDEEDDPIQPNELPWTEGALNYYKSINKYAYLMFDWVGGFDDNDIAKVDLNGKENYFSLEKQELLSPNLWFDSIRCFNNNGIAVVKLNDQFNWISLEKIGLLSPNQWFDWVGNFYDGIAVVRLNDQFNFFSSEKQEVLFPNLWFDDAGNKFTDYNSNIMYTLVQLNGKWYYLTLDGQLFNTNTKQPLSQEQVQKLFQQQQQIAEMVNRLVKNYLK